MMISGYLKSFKFITTFCGGLAIAFASNVFAGGGPNPGTGGGYAISGPAAVGTITWQDGACVASGACAAGERKFVGNCKGQEVVWTSDWDGGADDLTEEELEGWVELDPTLDLLCGAARPGSVGVIINTISKFRNEPGDFRAEADVVILYAY